MRVLKRVRPLLGTFVAIELRGAVRERTLSRWIDRGFAAVAEVERLMSPFRADSDLSRLNRAPAGRRVALDRATLRVLRAANALHRDSGGAFDPRAGAAPAPRGAPVELRGTSARRAGDAPLDLGGIAKGFAVDRAASAIRRAARGRLDAACVDAGGDLRVWGRRAAEIAIRPRVDAPKLVLRARIREGAVATSTPRDGARGPALSPAALVRPATGRVERARRAAVFAPRAVDADALTKVVLFAGRETAERCLRARGASALLFDARGRVEDALGGRPAR